MIRLLLGRKSCVVLMIATLSGLMACGGYRSRGGPNTITTVRLSPGGSASLTVGTALTFVATAQNSAGQAIRATFTYQSDTTGVLNFNPQGVACAGTWNAPIYSLCSPQGTGTVQVTATAEGVTSAPTYVFVHAPIDQIQVGLVAQSNPPPPCSGQQNIPPACTFTPRIVSGCYTANQPQTLKATAYSQGQDITASVGPFNWSAVTPGVVTLAPIVNPTTNFATNQATAGPSAPGLTQVVASAAGTSSQPYNFETCPVQCVAVQVGSSSQQSGQTSFITNKGTGESLVAWAVDVQGCIVPRPALTWVSSQPTSIVAGNASTGCAAGTTCTVTTPLPGSASITAACTPPSCNAGFPQSANNLVAPQPVYPVTAISGLANGAAGAFSVIATSTNCADSGNINCNVSLYSVSTSKNTPGIASAMPFPPNSMQFDIGGDRAYLGSPYGAMVGNPGNFGSGNSAFALIPAAGTLTGFVTGRVLAVAPRGNFAVFADNVSNPNYVYVVNGSSASSPSSIALGISGATAAAFSNDGLKAFIAGLDGQGNHRLFVYSAQQALQSYAISANAPVTGINFSSTGAFGFLNGGSSSSTISVRNTCDNQLSADASNTQPTLNFPAQPLFLKVLPAGNIPISGLNPQGLDVLIGVDNTGIDLVATNASQAKTTVLCSQTISAGPALAINNHIDIQQGTFHPINFFVSPDETQAYIVAPEFGGVLIYNLLTKTTGRILLTGTPAVPNPLPVSADMTPDGNLIYIAATDGLLHQVSIFPAADLQQISFPNLPNSANGFCSFATATPSCALNLAVIQP